MCKFRAGDNSLKIVTGKVLKRSENTLKQGWGVSKRRSLEGA
jgi:hypothetical protein